MTEKAYAQFNGSYNNIEGGSEAWALTELTGGIAMKLSLTWLNINKMGKDAFIEFVKTYLHKNALFCTGNAGDGKVKEGKERNGLITGHAYSLLSFDEIEYQDIIGLNAVGIG